MRKAPITASFLFEERARTRYGTPVAGIDEAGRGPWAGPVVAAAVVLRDGEIPQGLADSKTLGASRREQLFEEIMARADVGVGIADVARIDRDNILAATFWAMRAAVLELPMVPSAALVDGNRRPDLPCPAETLVKGDGLSVSIAAASIIAKVTRDRIMTDLGARHPGYGFERHKGYGTAEHRAALAKLGVTAHHRRSFKPVRLAADAGG